MKILTSEPCSLLDVVNTASNPKSSGVLWRDFRKEATQSAKSKRSAYENSDVARVGAAFTGSPTSIIDTRVVETPQSVCSGAVERDCQGQRDLSDRSLHDETTEDFVLHSHWSLKQSGVAGGDCQTRRGRLQSLNTFSWIVLWDLENVSVPRTVNGQQVVQALRHKLGAYRGAGQMDPIRRIVAITNIFKLRPTLRNELQANGVSVHHIETRGRKDAADKALIVELCMSCFDQEPPSGVALLSGDQDFAYPLAKVRNLGYTTVVIAPQRSSCSPLLTCVPDVVWSFRKDVLGVEKEFTSPKRAKKGTPPRAECQIDEQESCMLPESSEMPVEKVLSEIKSLKDQISNLQERMASDGARQQRPVDSGSEKTATEKQGSSGKPLSPPQWQCTKTQDSSHDALKSAKSSPKKKALLSKSTKRKLRKLKPNPELVASFLAFLRTVCHRLLFSFAVFILLVALLLCVRFLSMTIISKDEQLPSDFSLRNQTVTNFKNEFMITAGEVFDKGKFALVMVASCFVLQYIQPTIDFEYSNRAPQGNKRHGEGQRRADGVRRMPNNQGARPSRRVVTFTNPSHL